MNEAKVLIVGGGHAGAQCAIALRQNGFDGTITVVGREAELPYERPPLSKEYFAREKAFERLYIRPQAFWDDKAVHFELGLEVANVDPEQHCATLSDGRQFTYGKLVWAAGGDPRRLTCPGSDLAGIYTVRTREDCDRLMAAVDAGASNFVVIGGGYIGLEASAVLAKLDRRVTLLEALPRVLARVAGEKLSHFYECEHRLHGVDVRTDAAVDTIEGDGERVTGVRLGDGTVLPADAVIVGIGISPSIEPLQIAGAKCSNGVNVDEFCRTSLSDVYAIGDCAAFACKFAGGSVMRVESVQNANDMACCVAKALCGQMEPYHAFPWFWSNQYDLRLQTAGINAGFDQTVLRGSPDSRSFSVAYLKDGKFIAIDCVNTVKDFVQGRKLIEAGFTPSLAQLADPKIALKDLV